MDCDKHKSLFEGDEDFTGYEQMPTSLMLDAMRRAHPFSPMTIETCKRLERAEAMLKKLGYASWSIQGDSANALPPKPLDS